MLRPISIPGLFITATDTDVGKTVVTGAIAMALRRRGFRVGVCKPAATGCRHDREGLISEDAEMLAYCADTDVPLDIICPQRFIEPLAPAVAAERAGRPIDWQTIQRALDEITSRCDVLLVEGVGGLMVPMDRKTLVRDMIGWLGLPSVVVARPGLGTINHTLLTLAALREAKLPIAGVVVNRYPAENASIAEETNLAAFERWGKCPLLAVVPDEAFTPPQLPDGILAPIGRVDWESLAWQKQR